MSESRTSFGTGDLYLSNLDHYNKNYSHSHEDVFNIFSLILNNYLEHCVKTIYMKDQQYLYYIIENGINVIYNIFSFIYLYSKNLELTKQYAERGYYIYCEFIGKIGDNNHKYLQLNSKDATLFVLKKTIYELNNTYIRNFVLSNEEQHYNDTIKYLCEIYIKCVKLNIQVFFNIRCQYDNIHMPDTRTRGELERSIKLPKLNNMITLKNTILDNNKNILSSPVAKDGTTALLSSIRTLFDNSYEKQECHEHIKTVSNLIHYTRATIDEDAFIERLNGYLCHCIVNPQSAY